MNRRTLLIAGLGAFVFATVSFAHHSLGATYDAEKEVKLEGKIVQFLLRNPHSFLQIEAMDDKGVLQRWSLEWRSAGSLSQQGVNRETLKVGDVVTVTGNPSRTASDHRAVLKTLHRKSDGLGWGDRPGESVD